MYLVHCCATRVPREKNIKGDWVVRMACWGINQVIELTQRVSRVRSFLCEVVGAGVLLCCREEFA